MPIPVKIDGIYDSATMDFLIEHGIRHFSFDFRPTSFNFIQQDVFLKIMKQYYSVDRYFYMHFSDERNYVIDKFLVDLKKELSRDFSDNIFLEFSDFNETSFFEQFKMPFLVHHTGFFKIENVIGRPFFKGIVFDYNFLLKLHEKGDFFNLVKTLSLNPGYKFFLSSDWGADIFSSFFDFIGFYAISFPLNSKVEISYRNIDRKRLFEQLHYYNNVYSE